MLEPQSQATIQIASDFIIELEASICEDSFYQFVRMSWHVIEPHNDFVDNFHIKLLCDEMEACYYGKQTRLIINIPPRHMKSIIVSVMFPAWVWTKSIGKKFICVSYAESKARELSLICRTLITSQWYQERFPQVQLSKEQAEKVNFYNTKLGFRKAYGFDGAITGDGGDFILIDDPIKLSDGESEAVRTHVNYVMDNVIPSRLNNPSEGVIVLIMQRVNENDATGHMLEQGGWELLCLPEEYEGVRFVSKLGFTDPRTGIGELLWQERFPMDVLTAFKLNPSTYATQYQQRPAPLEGIIFKKSWFENRRVARDIRGFYLSCDTAFVDTEGSAKSAIVVFALDAYNFLIPVYAWSDKLEFPQLVNQIVTVAEMFPEQMLYGIIIEAKASGESVIQTIRQTTPLQFAKKLHAYHPPASLKKPERARVASKWCENGQVALPPMDDNNKAWLVPLEEEIFNAPNGKYMDLVDCLSQIILVLEPKLAEGLRFRLKAGNHVN